MNALGVEVINLLGNHDVSYLTITPRTYSLKNAESFLLVNQKLLQLNLQIAFQLDDYLVSHAGYTKEFYLEDWHFQPITKNLIDKLELLEDHIGQARGGEYPSGSPLWADFDRELTYFPNPNYPKQIVGHTPQSELKIINQGPFKLVGNDTFTVIPIDREPFFKENGSGEILLYDNGLLTPISLQWQSDDVFEKLNDIFYK